MRNSLILCEGSTDYTLLQYYMRKAHGWKDDTSAQAGIFRVRKQKSRILTKDDASLLTIASTGGCDHLPAGVEAAVNRIWLAQNAGERFERVVVVTDRDEELSEKHFIERVECIFAQKNVTHSKPLVNNRWLFCEMINSVGVKIAFEFLLLMIPFEQNGAMETFLLNAISKQDSYDKEIIKKCNSFVEQADPDRKYLRKRRDITKAKFDTYFSVRTPAAQFTERQNILKGVNWEDYALIQKDLKYLADL